VGLAGTDPAHENRLLLAGAPHLTVGEMPADVSRDRSGPQ
jgi:hypothetical protein